MPRGLSGVDGRDPSRPPPAGESRAARKMRGFRSAAVVVARLLLHGALGPRDGLEAVVGEPLAPLHPQGRSARDPAPLRAPYPRPLLPPADRRPRRPPPPPH